MLKIERGSAALIGSYWVRVVYMKGMDEDDKRLDAVSDDEARRMVKDMHRYERAYSVQAVQIQPVGKLALNQPEIDLKYRDVGPALIKS